MSELYSNVPNTVRVAVDNPIVELGKKLVLELGLEDAVDTLGRWMAHHIAELMADAETANINDRSAKEDRCRTAILEAPKPPPQHARSRRPVQSEQSLRAIASLDPKLRSIGFRATARERRGRRRTLSPTPGWLIASTTQHACSLFNAL